MAKMKYALKDGVFTFIFKQPEYARELYLALHPEDFDVTEAVTIPRPELYVVYTGDWENVPEVLLLSDLHGGAAIVRYCLGGCCKQTCLRHPAV